jgi:DNA-binding NtrC family response regulator
MKRILIIDESEIIRETLALILGREFIVSKRSLGGQPFRVADAHEEIDLLILGVAPQLSLDVANLARLAAQLPCAVLFIFDSKVTVRTFDGQQRIACLTKPFNPYDLHARVGQLLAGRAELPWPNRLAPTEPAKNLSRYLEYPYLTRSAASLVQRFAATRLPVLISGEIGCGQERVVRALAAVEKNLGVAVFPVSIDARELHAEDLAQKGSQLAQCRLLSDSAPTLLIENLDKCPAAAQWRLLSFLQDQEEAIGALRYLTTASCDLLERVYGGDFLEALYYKLATLTLKLPPLRERNEDIPVLAKSITGSYAAALDVVEPIFSSQAVDRLRNYLWFGNLKELETVIARTLTVRGGATIDAGDLVFDFSADVAVAAEPFTLAHSEPPEAGAVTQPKLQVYNGQADASGLANGVPKPVELSIVIHELAHELKNPMVTIKTFAQLLGDRYDDESFRARFQEIVGADIERMDDLLEVMIEFADFAQPKRSHVALGEKLRCVAKEIQAESTKRQTRFEWKSNGGGDDVHVDESQLTYVLRNVLLAVVAQAKLGSEIDIDVAPRRGSMSIAYLREGARVTSITHYLSDGAAPRDEGILPLRILLAKQLFERNGGRMVMDQSDPEKDILRLEFPIG